MVMLNVTLMEKKLDTALNLHMMKKKLLEKYLKHLVNQFVGQTYYVQMENLTSLMSMVGVLLKEMIIIMINVQKYQLLNFIDPLNNVHPLLLIFHIRFLLKIHGVLKVLLLFSVMVIVLLKINLRFPLNQNHLLVFQKAAVKKLFLDKSTSQIVSFKLQINVQKMVLKIVIKCWL